MNNNNTDPTPCPSPTREGSALIIVLPFAEAGEGYRWRGDIQYNIKTIIRYTPYTSYTGYLYIRGLQKQHPTLDATLDAALTVNMAYFLPLLTALFFDDERLLLIDTRLLLIDTRLPLVKFSREFEQEVAPDFKKQAL